jgi:gas vesicle protein
MGAVTGGGTVLAVSMSDPSAKLDPSALVGSVGIGCIAGLFYANSVGERAEREAEAGLKVENQQLRRDYQQSQHTLCILKNTCHIDGTPKSASEMKKEMERLDKATSTLQSGN